MAQYSSLLSESKEKRQIDDAARISVQNRPGTFVFTPDWYGYSRASLYFRAIADRKGVRGIMEVYESMRANQLNFFPAVEKEMSWNRERFEKEALRSLK